MCGSENPAGSLAALGHLPNIICRGESAPIAGGVTGMHVPCVARSSEQLDEILGYLSRGDVLAVLALNRFHLVFEAQLELLEPDFF